MNVSRKDFTREGGSPVTVVSMLDPETPVDLAEGNYAVVTMFYRGDIVAYVKKRKIPGGFSDSFVTVTRNDYATEDVADLIYILHLAEAFAKSLDESYQGRA